MKEKLKTLYDRAIISMDGLLKAIEKGWITVNDAVEIIGEDNSLEFVRNAKLNEISSACNTVIVNGIDLDIGDASVHFNLSIEDQANISNLFKLVELGGAEYPYQSDGGVCRVYSATEIIKIYFAAQTLITTQTTYHNSLKSYIQSLDDVDTISAVFYGMDLPEEYKTEMESKLLVAKQQVETITSKIEALK